MECGKEARRHGRFSYHWSYPMPRWTRRYRVGPGQPRRAHRNGRFFEGQKGYPTHQETSVKKETWKGGAPPWPLFQTKEMKVTNRHGKIYLKEGRTAMAAFPGPWHEELISQEYTSGTPCWHITSWPGIQNDVLNIMLRQWWLTRAWNEFMVSPVSITLEPILKKVIYMHALHKI